MSARRPRRGNIKLTSDGNRALPWPPSPKAALNSPGTACQRSIVIPSAESCEAAIEAAKQRFAELEGIPDWTLHVTFIEAGLLEDDASAGRSE